MARPLPPGVPPVIPPTLPPVAPPIIPPVGVLGANYNERFTWIDHDELHNIGAKWIRGFIDMQLLDSEHPEEDKNIKALFKAIDAGFKIVFSFKWNYQQRDFPRPGTAEHVAELELLDRLLHLVMHKVDVMVIGNEPFIETRPDQQNQRLNVFYESLAERVIDFRTRHNLPTPLYMGALNRLDKPNRRSPAVERFLRYIASKPELSGVDLHLHIPGMQGHQSMLDYALQRIRPDQTFLVTEFSPVWHWKRHLGDVVSQHFRHKYGYAYDTKVHQVLSEAIENPFPYDQWEEFLFNEPWYMRHRNFVSDSMRLYRSTGRLAVATYSMCPMRYRKKPVLETDNPWLLNGVYCASTTQFNAEGMRYENGTRAEDFRRALLQ